MTAITDLSELLTHENISAETLASVHTRWLIAPEHWQRCAEMAKQQNWRWAAGWGEQLPHEFLVHACLQKESHYLWLTASLTDDKPQLPSQAVIYPSASRSERHTQDMFGVRFSDHPDNRPWIRHQAWSKHDYPLRKEFPAQGNAPELTPPDTDYQFVKARGTGVYEIPVGPVHAGIIEPGHFRFQAVGETVLNLEQRLGYVHKGIEKIAEGRNPEQLLKLAARISGDSAVAHAWAACRAMEQAARIDVPERADYIRAILCERERIANHLGDVGAICNDVGFAFAQMQFTRLREQWQRTSAQVFGHRLLMDTLTPGGVKKDLIIEQKDLLQQELTALRKEMDEIVPALDFNSSLEDRLLTTGYLSPETAHEFGALGYIGRASGEDFDLRRDIPYSPYQQLSFKVAVENQGDVASRVWIRIKEIFAGLKLLNQLLTQLPDGDIQGDWQTPKPGSEGLAMVEGWRGEIICYLRFGEDNRIERFYPRDPSAINWPTLERIILNNIVPDFPVCNKSVNGSYSGHDL